MSQSPAGIELDRVDRGDDTLLHVNVRHRMLGLLEEWIFEPQTLVHGSMQDESA
jgi:hypothetical protein